MNVKTENIEVTINGEVFLVNLKWMRGPSRYNNGGNNTNDRLIRDKFPSRIIFGRIKNDLEQSNGKD